MSPVAEVAADVETKALVSLKSVAQNAAGAQPPPPKVKPSEAQQQPAGV